LDLVQPPVLLRREELDLLVERQLLPRPPDVAALHVRTLEAEAQLDERVQDGLLRRQRVHVDRVQVAGVHRPRDLQLGAHPDVHPAQRLPVDHRDRRLPGDLQPERHRVHRTRLQLERPAEPHLGELDVLLYSWSPLSTSTLACSPTDSPSICWATEPPWMRTSPWTTPPGTTLTSCSTVSTDAPPAPRLASSFLNAMCLPFVALWLSTVPCGPSSVVRTVDP